MSSMICLLYDFMFGHPKCPTKRLTSSPELRCLPPTTAAFELHVLRVRYQTMIWRAALEVGPPNHDPRQYGWSGDQASNLLLPVPLPSDVSPVPDIIQKLIKCGYSANRPCSTGRCSCVAAMLSGFMFSCCHAENVCHNERTMTTLDANEKDDESNDDSVD
ncbi:hypothetical protein Hamer_G007987 [Homarus americanus]|uniref:Uncharacterized protein n=1 Tax=Homarus americanus TaxID=6706 RepID=A0A8J5JZT3_HOMAM|nr:hypothetical protein Hamer_G007987 [Homarus americanus]